MEKITLAIQCGYLEQRYSAKTKEELAIRARVIALRAAGNAKYIEAWWKICVLGMQKLEQQ